MHICIVESGKQSLSSCNNHMRHAETSMISDLICDLDHGYNRNLKG